MCLECDPSINISITYIHICICIHIHIHVYNIIHVKFMHIHIYFHMLVFMNNLERSMVLVWFEFNAIKIVYKLPKVKLSSLICV